MSLEIWLGEAGSGKSTLLRQEIIDHALAHPEMLHLLLVPEQFCLSAQQKLVDLHPRHALMNIEALSFDRLAARAFRELNVETADVITDTAKTMFVALAVKDCKGKLQVYGKQALRPGFIRRLSSLFAEWTMNDLAPERLEELAKEESLSPLLR
ncbi:MAG: ATP-dependent helicase, partial [Lachnospiraceae bacterium]|nr:ATP-dependent helicase [Lachnospiraceae bacterium]